jgi:hypothetical protein
MTEQWLGCRQEPSRSPRRRSQEPGDDTHRDGAGQFPDRCFAFDQFGPLSTGHATARPGRTSRSRLGCRRPTPARTASGTSTAALVLGDDQLWGVTRRRKGGDHSLAALKSIRAARPHGAPIDVIMDNLSATKTPKIRTWAAAHNVELRLTPTYASWTNPIEAQFGPLRSSVMAASNHPNHPTPARRAAGLPALAQRQRAPPRRPHCATPRTGADPQRTPTTLGSPRRGMTR